MVFLRWLIGGLIGAVLGAIVWVGIGYALNAEVGYIALGVGFLCGLGVQIVGGEHDGFLPGIVAFLCATLSILVSKYMLVAILVSNVMAEGPGVSITAEDIVAGFADEIVEERNAAGKKLKMPEAYELEDESVPIE